MDAREETRVAEKSGVARTSRGRLNVEKSLTENHSSHYVTIDVAEGSFPAY
jgi:hypothetical protein